MFLANVIITIISMLIIIQSFIIEY